jgi:predicted MFS family arabinose efflux permease
MSRLSNLSPDLRRLLFATLFFGAAGGIFMATFNNYLVSQHRLGAESRGWLEFPRELPGFLVFLVAAALLTRMRESRMAVVALALTCGGALGLGLLAPGHVLLVVWVVIWSLGDHIMFAVEGPIGLKLAKVGKEGKRLGQIGGARNLGTIFGVGAIFLIARFRGDRYAEFYVLAAVCALAAAWFYMKLDVGRGDARSRRLVFRREYGIFYAISALFGIRKQIFLVFGSWVLVSLHNVSVSTIALLYFVASALGILLRPLMGEVIDWLGERTVLAVDELILLGICMVYAFASHVLPAPFDLWLLCGAYVLDHLLFALRVARTTYLKKIAIDPADITPTISLGITIDHAVAMTLPILSGYIWEAYGHEWVFILAGAIALAGCFLCLRISTPERPLAPRPATP